MPSARVGRFSDFLVTPWLQAIRDSTNYLALFSQDPYSVGSPTTVEISGSAYARAIPTFTLSGRLLTCTTSLLWSGIPAGTAISYIGAFDAAFNGNLKWAGVAPGAPIVFPNGGFLQIPANQYFVGLDT